MSEKLQPGMTLPDFELYDENGDVHTLSELQGEDPMILLLGRGEHCPRERQHQKELIKLHEWCAVGFANMVTVLPNDQHETYKLKISTPATWTYLCRGCRALTAVSETSVGRVAWVRRLTWRR